MKNKLMILLESRAPIAEIKQAFSICKIEEYKEMILVLRSDERKAIQTIAKTAENKLIKHENELKRMAMMFEYEHALKGNAIRFVAGLDEAGRGPLVGPVVAAAVILDDSTDYYGINDSKKLTAEQREFYFDLIQKNAIAYGVGMASHEEIDEINILNATKLAMKRAIESMSLKVEPEHLLIDAVKLTDIPIPQQSIIRGDAKSASIAAASILAKVTRDRIMQIIHKEYPQYGFDRNMGYGTDLHYDGLRAHGFTPYHRKSFLKNFNQ